jgi:hypothetical protein
MINKLNLTELLKISSLLLLMDCSVCAQEISYVRKNKSAREIQYTEEVCYSRSILVKDSIVYTANSNGALYATNLKTKSTVNLLMDRKFEEMRDIEFSGKEILGLQSGSFGMLARTDSTKFIEFILPDSNMWAGTFLDGMDILNNSGFIMGDPKKGFFSLYYSEDAGIVWKECEGKVAAIDGEAGFAASGTNVQVLNDSTYYFVSGGRKSRFFKTSNKGKTWQISSLPYMPSMSSGAFSIHMFSEKEGVIVGGDFKNPELNLNISFFTDDGGKFWINSEIQPRGYRSCVTIQNGVFYTCGTNGLDYSKDSGKTWIPFANGKFYALFSDGLSLFATAENGSFKIFDLINL